MSGELVAAAAGLVWLGMVLGISFLEAPLKFRAPGITVPLGLGIGRIVFGALNIAESVLAAVVVAGLVVTGSWPAASIWLLAAVVLLVVQVALVRPVLRRRSDRVIAGESAGERSGLHWLYPALETLKAVDGTGARCRADCPRWPGSVQVARSRASSSAVVTGRSHTKWRHT